MPKSTRSKAKSSSKSKKESKSSKKGSVRISKKDANKIKKSGSKSSSTAKFNRFADIERGDAPNKHTSYINGFFNVNDANAYMKSYISDTLGLDINCISTKYPFSATAETLMHHLTLTASQYAQKDSKRANLYVINAQHLQRAIRENAGYGRAARELVREYDPTARNYAAGFYVPSKTVKAFIETKTTLNKSNVEVTNDALNFICYYTETVLCDIVRTAYRMARVNRKSVGIKHFVAAAEDHLTGEVAAAVAQRLDEVSALFSNKKGGRDEDDDEDEEKDEEEKSSKKTKKASKKEESDNESGSDESGDESEEGSNGSGDESEEGTDDDE